MKLSLKEAETIVPVSRSTFFNDKRKGAFSVEKNARNKPVIDISELMRVYGDLDLDKIESEEVQISSKENIQESPVPEQGSKKSNFSHFVDGKDAEIAFLKKQVDFMEDQINKKDELLSDMNKALQKEQLILEDHRNKSDVVQNRDEAKIRKLEGEVANNNKLKGILAAQNKRIKELEAAANKSLWSRLFG